MILALDYDETYTEDKDFWNLVVALAKSRGHEVVCCTMRVNDGSSGYMAYNSDVEVDMGLVGLNIPIVYAATFKDKKEAMREHGHDVRQVIWIDDSPEFININ